MPESEESLVQVTGCGWIVLTILVFLLGLFLGLYVMPRLGKSVPSPTPSTYGESKEDPQ